VNEVWLSTVAKKPAEIVFKMNVLLLSLDQFFLRKMLGTRYGSVGTWFIWF